jgi:hypothetical protein
MSCSSTLATAFLLASGPDGTDELFTFGFARSYDVYFPFSHEYAYRIPVEEDKPARRARLLPAAGGISATRSKEHCSRAEDNAAARCSGAGAAVSPFSTGFRRVLPHDRRTAWRIKRTAVP